MLSPSIPHDLSLTQSSSTSNTSSQPIAAIYARVSTRDQADKGYSLQTQLEANLAWAKQHGHHVPEAYVFSEDYTGLSLNRPEFNKARELARQQRINVLIIYARDRMTRKLAHMLYLREEFERAGVQLVFVTSPVTDKTPESMLQDNVQAVFAEYERLKILERTRRGQLGRAKEGYPSGSSVPLGYAYVKHTDKGAHYEIDPEEADLVRRIFHLFVQQGVSMRSIAKKLTEEGVFNWSDRRRRGSPRKFRVGSWHATSIRCILTNEAYIGTLYYDKTESIENPDNKNLDPKRRKTAHRQRPKEEWIGIAVPSIVDQATFAAAQGQRAKNRQESPRNRKHDYLLGNGRLRCGQCGSVMTGLYNPNKAWRFYRCTRPQHLNPQPCRRTVAARIVEEAVWQAVSEMLHNPELIAKCVFHTKTATDSRRILPPIPGQSCHLFHTKAATDSIASLPPIPGQSCR